MLQTYVEEKVALASYTKSLLDLAKKHDLRIVSQDLESFFYFCHDPKKECELDFPGVKRLSFQISETNLPFLTGGDQIGIGCSLSGNDIRYVREIINFKDQTYQYKIQTLDSQLTKQVLADLKS